MTGNPPPPPPPLPPGGEGGARFFLTTKHHHYSLFQASNLITPLPVGEGWVRDYSSVISSTTSIIPLLFSPPISCTRSTIFGLWFGFGLGFGFDRTIGEREFPSLVSNPNPDPSSSLCVRIPSFNFCTHSMTCKAKLSNFATLTPAARACPPPP